MAEITVEQALSKLTAWCSTAEHCVSEATAKLQQWHIDAEEHQPIIQYLISEKYIDERRYCRAFVHDKFNFQGWGRQKLYEALRFKRIKGDIIEEALLEITDEESQQTLKKLLTAKAKAIKGLEARQQFERLFRFARSRGFGNEEIFTCLRQIGYDSE